MYACSTGAFVDSSALMVLCSSAMATALSAARKVLLIKTLVVIERGCELILDKKTRPMYA
jgi:hypothetical protein